MNKDWIVWNIRKALNLLKPIYMGQVNPYVIEWGEHFLFGSQEPKRLPKSLIPTTRTHILRSLQDGLPFGIAQCYDRGEEDWYPHPTQGVVGGFSYSIKSLEEKIILQCQDTWDFNEDEDYVVPFPSCDISPIIGQLKRFGLPIDEGETPDGEKVYGIS